MPFKLGAPKPPGSGRQAGIVPKASVRGILERLKCDPIKGMAELALDPKNPIGVRARMFAELAQYLHPKRRAIELSGVDGAAIEVNVNATELLRSRIAGLSERVRPAPGSDRTD